MSSGTAAQPRVEEPAGSEQEQGGRRRALLVLLALGALLAWAAYVVVAGVTAAGELMSARQHGLDAQQALLDKQPEAARDAFAAARAEFAEAEARLREPAMLPLRAVPVVRPNVRAATAMAAAGRGMAGAGEELAGTLAGLPGGLAALAPRDGTVPLDALEELAPPLAHADGLLAEVQRIVATIPEHGLLAPVADARAELTSLVEEAAGAVATSSTLVDALPAFLGEDGPKRYFLGAASPAELRGTGGLIGAYSILTVDRGRLDLGGFETIHDLETRPVGEIAPPNPDYAERYDRYGGAGHWLNINMTPDFPSAATAIEALYEEVTGDALDGTVVVTPQLFAGLLALTGPTEVPGGGTVDEDSVVPYVTNEAYGRISDHDQRKQLLGAVAAGALTQFLQGEATASPVEAVQVLGDAAGADHLLLHATDEDVQAAFDEVGLTGALGGGEGDFLAAVVNNAANHKADYYAERTVQYTVELDARGEGSARAAVELTNEAPTEGITSYVIGPSVEGAAAGDNRSLLSVYCAPGCERQAFRRSRGDGALREETELGHPVFTTMVDLPSGASERVELDWALRDVWTAEGQGGRYQLTVQDQPTLRPTRLVLDVRVPQGTVVTTASDGLEVDGDVVRWDGPLAGEQTFTIEFAPSRRDTVWEKILRTVGMGLH